MSPFSSFTVSSHSRALQSSSTQYADMAMAAPVAASFPAKKPALTSASPSSFPPSGNRSTVSPQPSIRTAPATSLKLRPLRRPPPLSAPAAADASVGPTTTFHGHCYVLKDNIDTDQIIPAEHLTLVPSNPDEYRKLGSLALVGLPSAAYPTRFVDPGQEKSNYSVIIAGANFGCGSSREHAPVALGAAGVRAVVSESYARIFFRNSVATGEVYPLESEGRLCDECTTGDVVTVVVEECRLVNHTTGKEYKLKPIGDAGPVIDAGGIFAYARKTGMIAAAPSSA